MKINKRLEEIYKKNAELEKQTPYNFCDRWCERCVHEKQIRCTLYKDELEHKITCIAHGRDEDDLEITEAVMEAQYKGVDEALNEYEDKLSEEGAIDFNDLPQDIQEHIKFVENNPLPATTEQYRKMAHNFLKGTFYKDEKKYAALNYDFRTVAWYHTLLPVKLQRALAGFHEPAVEGDISLYDAVAQLQVCKKAIKNSTAALRNIIAMDGSLRGSIRPLLALLQNIFGRIKLMEDEI